MIPHIMIHKSAIFVVNLKNPAYFNVCLWQRKADFLQTLGALMQVQIFEVNCRIQLQKTELPMRHYNCAQAGSFYYTI